LWLWNVPFFLCFNNFDFTCKAYMVLWWLTRKDMHLPVCILFFKTLYLPILKCLYFFIDRKKWIVAGVPCLHEATWKFLQTYTRYVFGLCPGDFILLIILFSGCHSCICFASEKYLSIVPWNYAWSLHLVVTDSPSVAEMTFLFFFYCKEHIKYDEKDPCRN